MRWKIYCASNIYYLFFSYFFIVTDRIYIGKELTDRQSSIVFNDDYVHNQEKYTCQQCNRTYKYFRNLKFHITHECAVPPRFQCHLCEYRSKQKSQLKTHLYLKHTDLKKFSCPYCSYKGKRKHDVKHHVFTRHPDLSSSVTYL